MSDTVTSEAIITAARRVSLTTSVITEWAQRGTPRQREYLHGFLEAEHASRQHATHMRLLKAARLPVMKTLDGYDWTAIRFPEGYGQDALTSLEFLDHGGDLVFYGDVGTGKTHLAAALVASACRQGIPARFFTTAGLVAHLRHAKHADRLDQQLAAIGRNKLVAIDLCRHGNYAEGCRRLLLLVWWRWALRVCGALVYRHSFGLTVSLAGGSTVLPVMGGQCDVRYAEEGWSVRAAG